MDRKASEVLLELEAKIDLILGYLKTIDLNNKIILNRLARDSVPAAANSVAPKIIGLPRAEVFMDSPAHQIAVPNLPIFPTAEATKKLSKKIPLQQQVVYPDGKPAVLVSVEIFDLSQNLVKKTRTNSIGKWAATLDPGKYIVHVHKANTADKPGVDRKFDLEVPCVESPIDLGVLK